MNVKRGSAQREAILCPVREWPISVANESLSEPYPISGPERGNCPSEIRPGL
jgi:hypothetical protein